MMIHIRFLSRIVYKMTDYVCRDTHRDRHFDLIVSVQAQKKEKENWIRCSRAICTALCARIENSVRVPVFLTWWLNWQDLKHTQMLNIQSMMVNFAINPRITYISIREQVTRTDHGSTTTSHILRCDYRGCTHCNIDAKILYCAALASK